MISYPDNVACLADYLENVLKKFADKPAYTALGQTLTFKDIDEKSAALAKYFVHEAKLAPGTKVAIQLPNLIQNPIAVYGALRAGLVVVNTNPLYTEREMKHQFTINENVAMKSYLFFYFIYRSLFLHSVIFID